MFRNRASDQAGEQVLQFLDDHRLDHSPTHYAFAHRFLSGGNRNFGAGSKASSGAVFASARRRWPS